MCRAVDKREGGRGNLSDCSQQAKQVHMEKKQKKKKYQLCVICAVDFLQHINPGTIPTPCSTTHIHTNIHRNSFNSFNLCYRYVVSVDLFQVYLPMQYLT